MNSYTHEDPYMSLYIYSYPCRSPSQLPFPFILQKLRANNLIVLVETSLSTFILVNDLQN